MKGNIQYGLKVNNQKLFNLPLSSVNLYLTLFESFFNNLMRFSASFVYKIIHFVRTPYSLKKMIIVICHIGLYFFPCFTKLAKTMYTVNMYFLVSVIFGEFSKYNFRAFYIFFAVEN